MDAVNEGRTHYRDAKGNEITKEEYEKIQGVTPAEEVAENANADEASANSDEG